MIFKPPITTAHYLRKCIKDALKAFNEEQDKTPHPKEGFVYSNVYEDDLEICMWSQGWGDTTCGFGGIGGQMITRSYIITIDHPVYGVRVYNNRFAYWLKRPNKEFYEDCNNRGLKMLGWSQYESNSSIR